MKRLPALIDEGGDTIVGTMIVSMPRGMGVGMGVGVGVGVIGAIFLRAVVFTGFVLSVPVTMVVMIVFLLFLPMSVAF